MTPLFKSKSLQTVYEIVKRLFFTAIGLYLPVLLGYVYHGRLAPGVGFIDFGYWGYFGIFLLFTLPFFFGFVSLGFLLNEFIMLRAGKGMKRKITAYLLSIFLVIASVCGFFLFSIYYFPGYEYVSLFIFAAGILCLIYGIVLKRGTKLIETNSHSEDDALQNAHASELAECRVENKDASFQNDEKYISFLKKAKRFTTAILISAVVGLFLFVPYAFYSTYGNVIFTKALAYTIVEKPDTEKSTIYVFPFNMKEDNEY